MAKSDDAKHARLSGLRLFKGANEEAISHLASAADEVTVDAGHVLIHQGRNHRELYVIESGGAVVQVDDEQVAEIPAGELVGELGYFTQTPASATVTTSAESTVLVIPYNRFAQTLDDNPKLVLAIATELAERLHAMDARMQHDHL